MKNTALNDIKNFAIQRLKQEYGYCGCAEGDYVAMLNSGETDENITINIKYKKDGGITSEFRGDAPLFGQSSSIEG